MQMALISGVGSEIKNARVRVNGKLVPWNLLGKYTFENRGAYGGVGQKVRVPPDHFYVLNDYPSNNDSRDWGFVPKLCLVGKVFPESNSKVKGDLKAFSINTLRLLGNFVEKVHIISIVIRIKDWLEHRF